MILLSILMTTCKPDPINNDDDDNNDTIQEKPFVKKYLVREYAYYICRPKYVIDWNYDFTRINHIIADSGTYDQINYDFDYYGEDSMRVSVYEPGHISKTNYICHLDNGKITKIDFYYEDILKNVHYRSYDSNDRLISNIDSVHNCGTLFEWEGDNVCKTIRYPDGHTTIYNDFSKHIHPYYTLPHLLPGYGYNAYITKPLWKNFEFTNENFFYEYDSDGYVTNVYYMSDDSVSHLYKSYEYDY